jgi:hypothetical protein
MHHIKESYEPGCKLLIERTNAGVFRWDACSHHRVMPVAFALCLVAAARIELEDAKAAQSAIEKIRAAVQSARTLAEADGNVLNVLMDDEASFHSKLHEIDQCVAKLQSSLSRVGLFQRAAY